MVRGGFPQTSSTKYGIWDLPQKITTNAKFRPLRVSNWDKIGTFLGPFWIFMGLLVIILMTKQINLQSNRRQVSQVHFEKIDFG